jgi:hypothetical protein
MKKIKFLFLFISLLAVTGTNNSYGASIYNSTPNPERYEAIKYLKISELVNLSAKQFSELTGKKMNTWDKLSFKIMKIKIKHDLKKNPNLTLKDYYGSSAKRLGTGWWILIGVGTLLLLLLVGFMIAYAGV